MITFDPLSSSLGIDCKSAIQQKKSSRACHRHYSSSGSEMVKKTMPNVVSATLCCLKNDNYKEYAEAWKPFITSCLLRKSGIHNLHEHCDCSHVIVSIRVGEKSEENMQKVGEMMSGFPFV